MADLRGMLAPTSGNETPTTILVRGRDTVMDRGGGTFNWRPASLAKDDAGIVVQPADITVDTVPGRWHRVFDQAVSPFWFGALGDGANDDAGPINAAIVAAGLGSYCLDLVGSFRITSSIQWDYPITIRADCDIFCDTGNYNDILYFTGVPSGKTVAFDLRGAKFAAVTGNLRVRKQTNAVVTGLCAIGSSRNLYPIATSSNPYLISAGPPVVGINDAGRGGSNTCWQAIEVYDLDFGVYSPAPGVNLGGPVYFDATKPYQANDLALSGGRVFVCTAATGDQIPGGPPSFVASVAGNWEYIQDDLGDPIPAWSATEQILANELRLSLRAGVKAVYRAVNNGTGGLAPSHGPSVPKSVGNTTWQYLRLSQVNSSLTGISIDHFYAATTVNAWTSVELSGDDSHVSDFRAQGCRGTAITLDRGFLSAGAIFIEGGRERYVNGPTDEGAFAVACGRESKLICQSLYLQGAWRGGVLVGQNAHIEGWCQPDQTFKTATGAFFEFSTDAIAATGRVTMSYNALRAHDGDYLQADLTQAGINLQDGDFLTWKVLPTDPVTNQLRVLSAARNKPTDKWMVVYRLLNQAENPSNPSAKPTPLQVFNIWRTVNNVTSLIGTGTVFSVSDNTTNPPTKALLTFGLVGATAPAGAARNFEIVTNAAASGVIPYRNIQSVVGNVTTTDQLRSTTASGDAVWKYTSGSFQST
jgi:hypothetical protein